jgi:arabinogalactan endo-1,4-beta-galactosidase
MKGAAEGGRGMGVSMLRAMVVFAVAGVMAANAPPASTQVFWLGADIGGATEMEDQGKTLYNWNGESRECTALMRELGFGAIRIRVWVNPASRYCAKEDVLDKALRAKRLGMPVMVDFHYSDDWADPSKQTIPAAWKGHDYQTLCRDVAAHTKEVLDLLKENGVRPKWVQVGNETSNGFLWPVGNATDNPAQYAGLFKAGYDAVKSVVPEAAVIVHLDNGFDNGLYNWNLDILRNNGARWDVIGLSVYPYWAEMYHNRTPEQTISQSAENMRKLTAKYDTDVMVVETGFKVDLEHPENMEKGRRLYAALLQSCRAIPRCRGVFYWEPQCRPGPYWLGAYDSDGRPTEILKALDDDRRGNGDPVVFRAVGTNGLNAATN